jgi:hypothetical protein
MTLQEIIGTSIEILEVTGFLPLMQAMVIVLIAIALVRRFTDN